MEIGNIFAMNNTVMKLVNKLKWKLSGLYYKKLYNKVINFEGKEDFTQKSVTYNKRGINIEPASAYTEPNNNGISFITLANEPYAPLLKTLLQSIAFHEKFYDITVYDLGLSDETVADIKNNPNVTVVDFREETKKRIGNNTNTLAQFLEIKLGIILYEDRVGKYDLKLFCDSACAFVGPVNVLKNFAEKNGFYAGITQTPTFEWGQHHTPIVNYWQKHFQAIQNPDYFGLEAGFMLFNLKHGFSQKFLIKARQLYSSHPYLPLTTFPFDQVFFSIVLNEVLHENPEFNLSLHPNTRAVDVLNGKDTFEKNALWRKGHGAPFFNYVVHMNSNDPAVVNKRYNEVELDYRTLKPKSR